MNGYKVGNRTFPDTNEGRIAAQKYAREHGLRVETTIGTPKPKPAPKPGETPVQRRIQEQKKKGPPP